MAGDPVAGRREALKLDGVREARRAPLDEARPAAVARQTLARLPVPPTRVARKHLVDPF